MRLLQASIVLGLLTAAMAFGPSLAAQQPIFSASTKTVPVVATVTDGEGRLVPNLDKDDFTVLDNGKPQELTIFQSDVQPFTAVVMLDKSASMTANLDRLDQAAEQFLLRLLPEDKAQVGAFSDKIEMSGSFTSDRDDLIGALKELQFGNPTRLYDAIGASLDALSFVEGRRVVVVFTDGDDTSSRLGLGTVLDRAKAEETMIYAIGLQSEYFNGQQRVRSQPDRGLRKLAEETGGGYFELKKTAELAPTFTRVAQELHSQYTLGFSPAALDGKEHKLLVKLSKPGLNARARKSYLASPDREAGAR